MKDEGCHISKRKTRMRVYEEEIIRDFGRLHFGWYVDWMHWKDGLHLLEGLHSTHWEKNKRVGHVKGVFFFLEDKCKLAPWEDESFRFLFLFLSFCFFYGKKKFWKTIGLGVFQRERGFLTEGDHEKEKRQK